MRSRSAVLLALVALAACASPTAPPPRAPSHPRGAAATPVAHVAVVVMENREYGQVIGSSNAPYVNRLANRYALATRFYGASHPSLPNYLALVGGSTFGISSDCTSCHVSGKNLVDQLQTAGISWRAYMEGMPSPCYKGSFHGRYAKKHDPFMYFDDVRNVGARCANVVPYRRLASDISGGTLPQFVWVTPDLCHDGHDCSTLTADHWLHGHLPPLLTALGKNGLLFLVWDEGATDAGCCTLAHGGHIASVVAGGRAQRGVRSKTAFDSYSILRTIEDLWGLAALRRAGCSCTKSMTALVR